MEDLVNLAKSKGIEHINYMLKRIPSSDVLMRLIYITAKEEVTE